MHVHASMVPESLSERPGLAVLFCRTRAKTAISGVARAVLARVLQNSEFSFYARDLFKLFEERSFDGIGSRVLRIGRNALAHVPGGNTSTAGTLPGTHV